MSRIRFVTLACFGTLLSIALTAPSDALAAPREQAISKSALQIRLQSQTGWRAAFRAKGPPETNRMISSPTLLGNSAKQLGKSEKQETQAERDKMYRYCMAKEKQRHQFSMEQITGRGTIDRASGKQAEEFNREAKLHAGYLERCELIRKA